MPLERRAEGPRSQARGATDIAPNRFPGVPGREVLPRRGNETGSRPRQKRCSRGGPTPVGARVGVAKLLTESDARRSDGRGGHRREPGAGAGGGKTQPWRGRDRSDDRRRTRSSLAAPRCEDAGETAGRALDAEPREAGGNPEAERGAASARHTDGDGSGGAASLAASVYNRFLIRGAASRATVFGRGAARRARRQVGRCLRCWRTCTWMRWIENGRTAGCACAAMPTTATCRGAARRRRSECWRAAGTGSRSICVCE